jgi:hypothetical protein
MEAYGLIDKLSDYALAKGWLFFNGDNYYTNIDADVEIADNQFVLRVNLNAVPTRSGGNRTNTINYTGLIALGRKREVVSGQETTEASLDESFEQKYNRRLKEMINTLSSDMGEFACANGCQILTENYIYDVNQFDTNIDFVVGQFNIEQFAFDYIEPATYSVTLETVGDGRIISNPTSPVNLKRGTVVSLGAAPDEGWSFEKWIVNNVENLHQIFGFNITNNVNAVAHFVKGAFVNVLHVFDTKPKEKGNRFYFGDYAKDNDVQINNVRVGEFSGSSYIDSGIKQNGQSVVSIEGDFFSTVMLNTKTIFYSYDGNATTKGIWFGGVSGNYLTLKICGGDGSSQIINVCVPMAYQYYKYSINWNGLIGGTITIIVNGITTTTVATHEFTSTSASNILVGRGFVGYIGYIKFDNYFHYVVNQGQETVSYNLLGGINGTIIGANLLTFWGSTSDEAEPFDITLGATLYELLGTEFGTEIITNGDFETGSSGWVLQTPYNWTAGKIHGNTTSNHYFFQNDIPVEAGKRYAFLVGISSLTRGEPFVSFVGAETFNRGLSQGLNIMTVIANHTGNITVYLYAGKAGVGGDCFFDNVSMKEATTPSGDVGSIMPICMDTPVEIDGFKRLGYFPPGSGILRGLPNRYEIPVDPELNTYLPAGDYDYDELMAIPASANIEMTKNDDTISLLKVHA